MVDPNWIKCSKIKGIFFRSAKLFKGKNLGLMIPKNGLRIEDFSYLQELLGLCNIVIEFDYHKTEYEVAYTHPHQRRRT